MRAIILAAGFGSRLMPLTKDVPKCMVEYQNKKLIDYEIEAMNAVGIKEIAIVGGYLFPVLQDYLKHKYQNLKFYQNTEFANTNMVYTLFCAREFLQDCINQKEDLLLSYADIVYFKETLLKLVACQHDLNIVVDKKWQDLWQKRFDDPLSDAETLKLDGVKIKELGKKPQDYTEIQGQYIGLFAVSHKFLVDVLDFYDSLDRKQVYDSKDFNNMYMTSFLQMLIDKFDNAYAVEIFGNWCEVDCKSDLVIDYIRE